MPRRLQRAAVETAHRPTWYTGSVSASCAHPAHAAEPKPYPTASTPADSAAASTSCTRAGAARPPARPPPGDVLGADHRRDRRLVAGVLHRGDQRARLYRLADRDVRGLGRQVHRGPGDAGDTRQGPLHPAPRRTRTSSR